MAIRNIPAPAPPPATLGQIPDFQSVLGGLSLQTAMLLAFSAYMVYRLFFSSPAKRRREELAKARDRYDEDVRKIKDRYR